MTPPRQARFPRFVADGSPAALAQALATLQAQAGITSALVLACDANGWLPHTLDPLLRQAPVQVFGGLFPRLAYGNRIHEHGTLVIGLKESVEIGLIERLSDPDTDLESALAEMEASWQPLTTPTTQVVFVDALAKRISNLMEALFMHFGLEANFIGGGAGSLSFSPNPCLLTPWGMKRDAALMARLPCRSSIGVSHGWHPVSEGMKVTASERNVIKTLDWHCARTTYQQLLNAHGVNETLTPDNFYAIAKAYPLGITRLDAEVIVRDPLTLTQEGHLVCVGDVPEGCFVKLLHGHLDSLLEAAREARATAMQQFDGDPGEADWLLFDCISRALFLGEQVGEEIDAVSQGAELYGAFTLGEIANADDNFLNFHNKTTVLGLLERTPSSA